MAILTVVGSKQQLRFRNTVGKVSIGVNVRVSVSVWYNLILENAVGHSLKMFQQREYIMEGLQSPYR